MKFVLACAFAAVAVLSATTVVDAKPSCSGDNCGGSSPPSDCGGYDCGSYNTCQWNGNDYSYGDWATCDNWPSSSCKWYSCQCTEHGWQNCYNNQCYYNHKWYESGDSWGYKTKCKGGNKGRRVAARGNNNGCQGGNCGGGNWGGNNGCQGGNCGGDWGGNSYSCGYYCYCGDKGKYHCEYTDSYDPNNIPQ